MQTKHKKQAKFVIPTELVEHRKSGATRIRVLSLRKKKPAAAVLDVKLWV